MRHSIAIGFGSEGRYGHAIFSLTMFGLGACVSMATSSHGKRGTMLQIYLPFCEITLVWPL